MPLLFRVSVADDLIDSDQFKVVGTAELVHPTDNNEWVNVGVETTIVDLLAVRAGYRINVDEGALSFGAGLRPSLGGMRLVADYAYSSMGAVFGATHRISVGFSF